MRVSVTQMWDAWDVRDPIHRRTIDRPDRYALVELSQNSQVMGQDNWDHAQAVYARLAACPRPINSTKIYGNDAHPASRQGNGTAHAIATFWRNNLGGFASSRFHRPTHGLGGGTEALR